jgi:cobalamin biosynthesis Mg chelatase CobN
MAGIVWLARTRPVFSPEALRGEALLINDFDTSLHNNPELAEAVGERIREQVLALGLTKDPSLDLSKPESPTDEVVLRFRTTCSRSRASIPYGLHTFGRVPDKPLRDTTVDAIVSVDRSLLPSKAKVLAEEMDRRIVASGARELDSLMRGLRGGFITGGGGGEPVPDPDSSRRFFICSERKPVCDVRAKVVDVEVIPHAKLGRPRVDIVIAPAAEGMFSNVTNLMDQAVQKVKAIDEAENYVRNHYLKTKAILVQRGFTELEADRRAGVRIFDEPPGTFNLNTSTIVANCGTWDTDKGIADDYLRKLGHGYGNGFWGDRGRLPAGALWH